MNLESINLDDAFHITFEPQEDITAYELAQILCLIFKGVVLKQEVEKLGLAQRHIKIESIELSL